MPIDFRRIEKWSSQLTSSREMLNVLEKKLLELPQGGTAVGSGIMLINSLQNFAKRFQSCWQ